MCLSACQSSRWELYESEPLIVTLQFPVGEVQYIDVPATVTYYCQMNSWVDMAGGFLLEAYWQRCNRFGEKSCSGAGGCIPPSEHEGSRNSDSDFRMLVHVPSALTFPPQPSSSPPPPTPRAPLPLPLPLTHLEVLLDDHVVAEEQRVTRTPRVGDLACGGNR